MAALNLAGTYRREVGASVARIWENVFDWEHLPALHSGSFDACDLIGEDAAGWRIRLRGKGAAADQLLKLDADRAGARYRVVTEAGPGATSEIRVTLTPRSSHETGVVVEYHVPEADPARLALIGRGFVAVYEQLWDEDEAMMRAREAALTRPRASVPERLDLGAAAAGSVFDFGPGRFRLIEAGGALIAHSVVCPHWLGPLDGPVEDGCVTCPWHSYRFDVATGRSADGRGLRLAPAPRIVVEDGRVTALRAGGEPPRQACP